MGVVREVCAGADVERPDCAPGEEKKDQTAHLQGMGDRHKAWLGRHVKKKGSRPRAGALKSTTGLAQKTGCPILTTSFVWHPPSLGSVISRCPRNLLIAQGSGPIGGRSPV